MEEKKNIDVDKCFLIHEINSGKFMIYNVERHVPVIVDATGKRYFDIACNNRDLESCKQYLTEEELDDFISFLKRMADLQVLDNSASEKIEPRKKPPKTAYLHLTYKCNLSCEYCYNMDIRKKFNDLSFEHWKTILNKLLPVTDYYILTGGEPFLYHDLHRIVNYIKSYNSDYQIEILSNGMIDFSRLSHVDHIFDKLYRITFSCDNFEKKNQLRKGFHIDTFKRNIEWLIQQGYAKKIGLSSVYFKDNLEGTLDVKEYCKKNCLQHRRVLVIPNNREEIPMMPSLESFIESLVTDDRVYDSTTFFKRLNCGAGVGLISIDPEGNCYPCQNLHYPGFDCGNILNDPYENILDSKVINQFRSDLFVDHIEKCKECKFRYVCGGGCRAASYRLEGRINAFPEVMCSYYKALSIHKLANGVFFNPEELLARKEKINNYIEKEFVI